LYWTLTRENDENDIYCEHEDLFQRPKIAREVKMKADMRVMLGDK